MSNFRLLFNTVLLSSLCLLCSITSSAQLGCGESCIELESINSNCANINLELQLDCYFIDTNCYSGATPDLWYIISDAPLVSSDFTNFIWAITTDTPLPSKILAYNDSGAFSPGLFSDYEDQNLYAHVIAGFANVESNSLEEFHAGNYIFQITETPIWNYIDPEVICDYAWNCEEKKTDIFYHIKINLIGDCWQDDSYIIEVTDNENPDEVLKTINFITTPGTSVMAEHFAGDNYSINVYTLDSIEIYNYDSGYISCINGSIKFEEVPMPEDTIFVCTQSSYTINPDCQHTYQLLDDGLIKTVGQYVISLSDTFNEPILDYDLETGDYTNYGYILEGYIIHYSQDGTFHYENFIEYSNQTLSVFYILDFDYYLDEGYERLYGPTPIVFLAPTEPNISVVANEDGSATLFISLEQGSAFDDGNYTISGDIVTDIIAGETISIEYADIETDVYNIIITNNTTGCATSFTGALNAPLPIELISFEAEAIREGNLMTWSVATEENVDYYSISRSRGGSDFMEIAQVKAAGNSNSTSTLEYEYLDRNTELGCQYYQLTAVDLDTQKNPHGIRNICRNTTDFELSFYPNPATKYLEIDLYGNTDFNNLIIINAQGRVVLNIQLQDETNASIDIKSLPDGVYFTQLSSSNEQTQFKWVKTR